jgi:8-oxo-dGTP diphosphatase
VAKSIEKVIAYITRGQGAQKELLVFEQEGMPEAGIRVPAGTIEHGEPFALAVVREVEEESGFVFSGHCRPVGRFEWLRADRNELHFRNVFHLEFSKALPTEWAHEVTGHGEDGKLVFRYFWMPIAAEQGAYLTRI